MTSSLKVGDCLEATIETIAFGGDGVGRVAGLVVFVPYTAAGDRVKVRITTAKKNYLRGRIENVLHSSQSRTQPKCRYYMLCGGCHYQHITYEHQLQLKKNQIAETYRKIGRMDLFEVEDCIPSPKEYHYRGKAEFHIECFSGRIARGLQRRKRAHQGETPSFALGFMPARGNRTIDIDRCEIVDESINRAYAAYRARLRKEHRPASDGDLLLWSEGNPAPLSPVLPEEDSLSLITRQVKGCTHWVPRDGFFQANLSLIDGLVESVLTACDLKGTETVVDGFCGSGLFALFAARQCRHVIGVEMNPDAVHCARLNAQLFGCSNATFYATTTEDLLAKLMADRTTADVVILDPPRVGCTPEVVAGVIALAPGRIVYVSCDPATQARDLCRFIDQGYRVERIQPIDMFPQTKHIEVIATLRK